MSQKVTPRSIVYIYTVAMLYIVQCALIHPTYVLNSTSQQKFYSTVLYDMFSCCYVHITQAFYSYILYWINKVNQMALDYCLLDFL